MTKHDSQKIQKRLALLTRAFCLTPKPTREEVIYDLAMKLMDPDDLWLVARVLDMERSDRPLDEREQQAFVAHNLAIEKATKIVDRKSRRRKPPGKRRNSNGHRAPIVN